MSVPVPGEALIRELYLQIYQRMEGITVTRLGENKSAAAEYGEGKNTHRKNGKKRVKGRAAYADEGADPAVVTVTVMTGAGDNENRGEKNGAEHRDDQSRGKSTFITLHAFLLSYS